MSVTTGEAVSHKRPQIRQITTSDVHAALLQGWADFRAAPNFGLFFGGIYAIAGIFILLQLMAWNQPLWIIPLACAFPIIGPFVALGLYEVSRRREENIPLVWGEVLSALWGQRNGQMPFMAFIVLAAFMVWIWFARLLVAVILGRMSFAVYSDFNILFTTGSGLTLLFFGTLVGFIIAFCIFSFTVMALPLLLDRDIDFVTAMITSVDTVKANPRPMLTWAWIVAATLIIAMIPFFLGLIIALPVLGHGTWHLYRKAIAEENIE
ncbi:DUF2189 domain-containing protein [Amaricoccus macauensis]|uniref:DUF2189 domain-containing protein n=1 Tax=Amaricoccus macauensis TaxID=57001 RepID=UPI003C7B6858